MSGRLAAIAWSLGTLAWFASLAGRLRSNAEHVLDQEGTFVANLGRQLVHGRVWDAVHWQLDFYRGEPLVDGALTAVGFLAFGDQALAWFSVSLAYGLLAAAAGSVVLLRTTGVAAAVCWPLLLAASPFALKDGLLANTVGHAATPVYALLALAALSWPGRPVRGALLGGAVAGLAVWFQRSSLLALPAVGVAAAAGGTRSVLAALVGGFVGPVLAVGNAAWAVAAGALKPRADESFWGVLARVLFEVRGGGGATASDSQELAEALGVGRGPLNFALGRTAAMLSGRQLPFATLAGHAWSAAWAASLGLGLLGPWASSDLERPASWADRCWRLVPWLLAAGWIAGYLATPYRVEDAYWRDLRSVPPIATHVSVTRYVTPIWLVLTFLLAHGLGALASAGPRARALAASLLAALLLPGAALSARDGLAAEPPSVLSEMPGYGHRRLVYQPGFGPPEAVHRRLASSDPVDRALHLRAIGAFIVGSSHVTTGSVGGLAKRWREACEQLNLQGRERAVLAHGLGMRLGNDAFERGLDAMVPVARALAAELGGGDAGEALLRGFADEAAPALRDPGSASWRSLCEPGPTGEALLCALALDQWLWSFDVTADWQATLGEGPAESSSLSAAAQRGLVRGLGRHIGGKRAPSRRRLQALEQWPAPLREAFLDGVRWGERAIWLPQRPLDQLRAWELP